MHPRDFDLQFCEFDSVTPLFRVFILVRVFDTRQVFKDERWN